MKRSITIPVFGLLLCSLAPTTVVAKERHAQATPQTPTQAPGQAPAPQQSPTPAPAQGAAPTTLKTRSAHKAKMRWLLSVIKKEPTVQEVQKAATEFYQLEPERIVAMARNARLKGLIPDINTGMSNRLVDEYRNTRDGLYPQLPNPPNNPNPHFYKERTQASTGELSWDVQLHWSLDRLMFASESLDAKSLTSLNENLVREVTTLFYSRRRIMISLVLSPPTEPEEYLYELTRLDEITSTLDALTGGMFAKRAWRWQESDLPGLED
jgi:hypothetical protein